MIMTSPAQKSMVLIRLRLYVASCHPLTYKNICHNTELGSTWPYRFHVCYLPALHIDLLTASGALVCLMYKLRWLGLSGRLRVFIDECNTNTSSSVELTTQSPSCFPKSSSRWNLFNTSLSYSIDNSNPG